MFVLWNTSWLLKYIAFFWIWWCIQEPYKDLLLWWSQPLIWNPGVHEFQLITTQNQWSEMKANMFMESAAVPENSGWIFFILIFCKFILIEHCWKWHGTAISYCCLWPTCLFFMLRVALTENPFRSLLFFSPFSLVFPHLTVCSVKPDSECQLYFV